MPDMTTLTPVGAGPAAVALPLTWAQENMWDASWGFGPDAPRINLRRAFALPRPVPLAEMRALLTGLGARYDILRTTFDHAARRQVTHSRVEVPVALVGARDVPPEGLADLAPQLSAEAFDHAGAPPWRVALACDRDDVRAVVVVLSHLAFDAGGANVLRQLVLDAVAGGAPGAAASPTQVGDLVRYEASDAMRAGSDQALGRWREVLAALPPGCGIRRPAPGSYSVVALRSAAVAIAAQAVAVRTRTNSGLVIAAALSLALRRRLPRPPSLLLATSSNRHHPDLARYLGLALQNAFFVIPQGEPAGFDEYVRRCFTAAMAGYKNARYDNGRFRAEQFAAQARGGAPDLSFFFNDARPDRTQWTGLEALAGTLGAARGGPDEPAPAVVDRWSVQDATFFFTVAPAGRRCAMVVISDDRLIGPEAAADVLDHVRDLLVAAATS